MHLKCCWKAKKQHRAGICLKSKQHTVITFRSTLFSMRQKLNGAVPKWLRTAFIKIYGSNTYLCINNSNLSPNRTWFQKDCEMGLLCIYLPFLSFGKVTSFEEEILLNCCRLTSQKNNNHGLNRSMQARYNVQLKYHKKFQTLSHSVSLLPVYKKKINTWRNNTAVAGKMSDPE